MTKEQAEEAAQGFQAEARANLADEMAAAADEFDGAAPDLEEKVEYGQSRGLPTSNIARRARLYRLAAYALRACGPMLEALERIGGHTHHDPSTTRADAFATLNRITGAAQSALALARKEP